MIRSKRAALSDFIAVALSCCVLVLFGRANTKENIVENLFFLAFVAILVLWLGFALGQYGRLRSFWDELREVFISFILFIMASGFSAFYIKLNISRADFSLFWLVLMVLLPLGRWVTATISNRLSKQAFPVIIYGIGENSIQARRALISEFSSGCNIIAHVDPDKINEESEERLYLDGQSSTILTPTSAMEVIRHSSSDLQVFLAFDSLEKSDQLLILTDILPLRANVHIIPPLKGLPLYGSHLSHFFAHEVLFLTVRNNLKRVAYHSIKRIFDLTAACIILLLVSPIFIILSLIIIQDGGKPFFGHTRIGKNGKKFRCLKFRSMSLDADKLLKELLESDPSAKAEWEKDFKLRNDPRITKVGSFLRRSSLDELPQLLNVITGEMSLVGPRPVIDDELIRYGDSVGLYLQVRPGMTGLWQVSGRNDTSYDERVSLDAWYVRNWSLWYDVVILFKTISIVINRAGAY